jgi:hypothetical protein
MRDWKGDLEWYRNNRTAGQIGFDPDGMCLKICRTSRDIGPKYLTAKQCQDAVPKGLRVTRVRDLRAGMKLFFDDPHDSNTAGHIVTMIGRVRGGNWDSLDDVLVATNSVVANSLVVVRASYFKTHWGDSFQFGAGWINGIELDYPGWKTDGRGAEVKPEPPKPKKDTAPRVENFRQSGNEWDLNILDRAVEGGRKDIAPKLKAIEQAVKDLPDDLQDEDVNEFIEIFKERRVLKMALLNRASEDARKTRVITQRNRLRVLIKSVLRH